MALAAPVGALVANWAIASLTGNRVQGCDTTTPGGMFPAPFFIAAVMVAAQVGGSGPALVSLIVSCGLLDFFFMPPANTFYIYPKDLPSFFQFLVPTLMGWWFIQKRKEVELLLERETALAKRLQGEQSPAEVGHSVLDYLAPELGAPIAAFYTVEPDGSARRRASYAFDIVAAPEVIAREQGPIGQAATDPRPQILAVPPDYVTVSSSLGRRRPSHLMIMPAADGHQTQAVMEIGFFRRPGRSAERLLKRITEPIAIAVRTAAYRAHVRSQAEELKAQDEELRATNEELEARGRELVESQQKLEEQQIELEQTNLTLQEQARRLEQQNEELAEAHAAIRLKSESAERANRAKSGFLANMSHELRTPLNSALILAKLLAENRDRNLTAEQIRFAETIYEAGNDLLAMIDDILDLAKIEAGKVDLRTEEVSLERLRDELARTFEPIATKTRLHFEARIADGARPSIQTDPQRLGQILKNLLSNAFKFTEEGEVSLEMTGDGERSQFIVRDTGVGIEEAQLAAIFEPFRQADGTTSRKYGGTGLGLSISRDLARMLGGDIQVASTAGKGSAFTLSLPSAHMPSRSSPPSGKSLGTPWAPPSRTPAVSGAETQVAAHDDRTILVIEDDARFADIVVGLARELGFDATVAPTAEDAIRMATARPPKGIVLDIQLPDHSGLEVLERLKRDPRTRHIPVHVISVADEMRPALEMGAIGYARKPIQREEIQTALRRLEAQFTRRLRRLLVVEDDLAQREAIGQLLSADGVEIVPAGTVKEALEQLRAGSIDCIVTDLSLPDASGCDLLETMAKDQSYSFPSVVVYTGGPIGAADEELLRKYASSIVMKSARSPERLLDEVTLFLHQVESELPPERQRMLQRRATGRRSSRTAGSSSSRTTCATSSPSPARWSRRA